MDLLQLRYFFESANNENFSKTAKSYNVPTTSVSASIKRLEDELNCKLFDRTANKIRLNENGQKLQRSLCNVFNELDRVVEELSDSDDALKEINILVRGMRRNITEMITDYSLINRHVKFKTVFDHTETNHKLYDIIIDDKKEQYDGFERIELFNMRLCLQASSGSKFCHRKITLNELCKEPFISMHAQSNMHKILEGACKRAGFTPDFAVICNDIECYEKFVAAGMGIGIARKSTADSKTDSGICELDVTDFFERYTVYAYYSKSKYQGTVKNFIDFMKSRTF